MLLFISFYNRMIRLDRITEMSKMIYNLISKKRKKDIIMQSTQEHHHFIWTNFLLGVLFVVGGMTALNYPGSSLVGLTTFIGIIAIFNGIYSIFLRSTLKQITGYRFKLLIIIGIFDIFIGIFLLFNLTAGILTLPYIFSIWFITDSIGCLFSLTAVKTVNNFYFWFQLIISILGIIIGISLFFDPISSALTVSFLIGFYLLIFGITNIIDSFMN